MPTLAGNKHLSIHFLPHRPRPVCLWTENGRTQSVRNGYQTACSRADSLFTATFMWIRISLIGEHRFFQVKYQKRKKL